MYPRPRIITAGSKNVFDFIHVGPNQINLMTFPCFDVCDVTNHPVRERGETDGIKKTTRR